MQNLKRPKIHVLKGEEATAALEEYIRELKENKPEELTEKQTRTMIKLAQGLLSAVEDESIIADSAEGSTILPKIKHKFEDIFSALKTLSTSATDETKEYTRENHYHPRPNRMI